MDSSLVIKIEQREGNSFLRDAYVTQPFRIVPVGQYKKDKASYLMIMSSSPGLLDNDLHDIRINMAADTVLQLQTQAYQRLYNMKSGAAQHTTVRMEEGAAFSYVPHPVVPQTEARFQSVNKVYMQDNCQVLWSDIVTCGRKMSGEEFQYHSFQTRTEVYLKDRLVVKDNVLLSPKEMPVSGMGMFEGYTHQGSLLFYSAKDDFELKEYIDLIHEKYHAIQGIVFGISALQGNGFMVRILGMGAEQLFKIFKEIETMLWEEQFINKN